MQPLQQFETTAEGRVGRKDLAPLFDPASEGGGGQKPGTGIDPTLGISARPARVESKLDRGNRSVEFRDFLLEPAQLRPEDRNGPGADQGRQDTGRNPPKG